MPRCNWFWAHTASLLTHGAYMAGSMVAFVVAGHSSMGNFEDSNEKCNSMCIVKAWGSSGLVSPPLPASVFARISMASVERQI
jgi:hypothetical protein